MNERDMPESQERVLVVDDDRSLCKLYSKLLGREGVTCACAHTLADGLERARQESFSVVLLDLSLPDGNGLEWAGEFAASRGRPEIIIITGLGGAEAARLALEAGVWDYVEKSDDLTRTRLSIMRAVRFHREKTARQHTLRVRPEGFIAASPVMGRVMADAAVAASGELNVTIAGETGTGKELLARGIHAFSRRAEKPFVVVDCTALPEALAESTLFGHVKGAFTGATERQTGLVEAADGGTLFMDEIGDLPLALQAKFLRVLQEKIYLPVGCSTPRRVDFRLISATNRDLARMVEEGAFRKDLYFRVAGMSIRLPPLRERTGDVGRIARHHLQRLGERDGTGKEISPDLLEAVERYPWPGNVRELVNAVEVAWARGQDSPVLYSAHLPGPLRLALYHSDRKTASPDQTKPRAVSAVPDGPEDTELPPFSEARALAMERFEREYLGRLSDLAPSGIQQALDLTGLSRSRLYALLKKHGISLET